MITLPSPAPSLHHLLTWISVIAALSLPMRADPPERISRVESGLAPRILRKGSRSRSAGHTTDSIPAAFEKSLRTELIYIARDPVCNIQSDEQDSSRGIVDIDPMIVCIGSNPQEEI